MRSALPSVLVFLLLGAATNLAVAWACALRVDVYQAEGAGIVADIDGHGVVEAWQQERIGARHVMVIAHEAYPGAPAATAEAVAALLPDGVALDDLGSLERVIDAGGGGRDRVDLAGVGLVRDERGWPLRGMWCSYAPVTNGVLEAVDGGIVLANSDRMFSDEGMAASVPPVLPIRVAWGRFALGALFYTGFLALLVRAPGLVRRPVRRVRGLCPGCGYPVTSPGRCPECGADVRIRGGRAATMGGCGRMPSC